MFSVFFNRPHIARNPPIRLIQLKSDPYKLSERVPYFLVASVEVGNTTTKCILTATNLKDGRNWLVNKTVKMTRDVRPPRPGERIFGKTLSGVSLTRESIAELVRDTLLECHREVGLDIKTDLDFAVRSTGVVAGFASPDEIGEFIKALADGCMLAGIPPKKMVPALSIENIPAKFRDYCYLDKVIFTGAVGGVLPPKGSTGVEIVANEMEGELATAGIKEGAKWTGVDFRNPCFSMDFGTTLKGRITDDTLPYARTIGNLCGYAGAIPDALLKGTGLIDRRYGAALEIPPNTRLLTWTTRGKLIERLASEIHTLIKIEKVPPQFKRYGSVPVNPAAAEEAGVTLIGCDVGVNGSDMDKLSKTGSEIYQEHGLQTLMAVLDLVSAKMVSRLLQVAMEENIIDRHTSIGITGRAGITGRKPNLILQEAKQFCQNPREQVVFVDDGLARGAAVMARCMNSLGTPKTPLGGVRGGRCVMKERIKHQQRDRIEMGAQDLECN